jgi:hypothetical protein
MITMSSIARSDQYCSSYCTNSRSSDHGSIMPRCRSHDVKWFSGDRLSVFRHAVSQRQNWSKGGSTPDMGTRGVSVHGRTSVVVWLQSAQVPLAGVCLGSIEPTVSNSQ